MAERLTGARVERLRRRSKYILADMDTGETLLIHLGMSGRVLISGEQLGAFLHDHAAPQAHDHIVLDMEGGARVTYNDPRRFGMWDLMETGMEEGHRLLAGLGPEPLGNAFDEPYLVACLKGRNTPIKAALLDQRVVAGLGNIYACEALFRAGLSPRRLAANVAGRRTARLVAAIKAVLEEAIAAGGSSLRDYVQATGELGYFQHAWRVYDREGLPCRGCSCDTARTGGVRRIVQSGRSTFLCPVRQR
jgi:formamidopyrimidine-DNA glycosylase